MIKPIRTARLAAALLLLCPLLSGCWDRLEIEERAVVLGISIDSLEETEQREDKNGNAQDAEDAVTHLEGQFPTPQKPLIRLAAQIALPGRIPLGPGESGGGETSTSRTVWVVDVVGHSIDDALMNLQQQIASKLFFGHLRVIVVSEAVARKGLDNLNDYLRRNSEVRRTAWMLVTGGKAIDLMKSAPKLERVPTMYLLTTLDEAVRMGKFPLDFIGMFWSSSVKRGQEGFLPYVKVMKEDNVALEGLAYFQGSRMVGRTSPLEIAAYLGIKGKNPAGYRTFIRLEDSPGTLMVYATHRKSDLDVDIRNGKPYFHLNVFLEINLEEKTKETAPINNPDILKKIEKEDAKVAQDFYARFIQKTQRDGADIFGFGEYVRAKCPGYWSRYVKTKEQWQKLYPEAVIEIDTTTYIRRVGMKAK